jgi:hypothetical protein
MGSLSIFRISEADDPIGNWALLVNMGAGGAGAIQVDSLSRMWLIVRYVLLKTS